MMKDHYRTLGLQKGASQDDIKKAYRNLAKQWHPDKNNAPGAEERFKEIGAAYDILKCPDKRKIWERDYNLAKTTQETPRPKQKPSGGTNSNYYESNFKTYASNTGNNHTSGNKGTSGRRFSYSYEQGPGHTKFSFFFTDSDYDDEFEPQTSRKEKGKKKKTGSKNRRYSFSGPSAQDTKHGRQKWDNDWNGAEQANKDYNSQRRFSFNFGVFNVFNDGEKGFKAFFKTPFDTFFDEAPSFAFSDEEEEFQKARQERTRLWRESSEKFAGQTGDPDWYDWSRGADLGDSYDEDDDTKSTCVYCGQTVDSDIMMKHEAKCRILMGGEYFDGSKLNWRQRHEDFINMLRHTRRASQAERKGKSPPTPPPGNSSDLIMCKFCFRKFNHKVASKHIQFCEQKLKETGRPSNPLGQGAEARDYMSKNYTAREYAKTIPKPNSRRNSKVDVDVEDLGSDLEADNVKPDQEDGFPDININGNSKPFMESPYVKTKTGLHTARATSASARRNSHTKRPRSRPNSTNKKSPKIDVNMNPYKVNPGSGKATGNEGCAACQRKYGKNSSKFVCSCGTKKAI